MKAVKRVLVAVAAFTMALNAWATWNSSVTEGYFDDPANWSEGLVPTNTVKANGSDVWNAQWWCSTDWDSTVLLRDWAGTFNMFSLNLYNNNTLVFDGAGADFRMTALPEHYKDRNGNNPLAFYNGSGPQMMALDVGSKRGEGFRWTNVLMRVVHTMGEDLADLTDNVLSVAFARGWASFAGMEGSNSTYNFAIDGAANAGGDLSLLVTNGAHVVMPNLSLNGLGSRRILCAVRGEGSQMTVNGNVRSGCASTYKSGTNVIEVTDGGRLDLLDRDKGGILIGNRGEGPRTHRFLVSGSNTELNAGTSMSGMEFNGNLDAEFSDGAKVIFPYSVSFSGYFAGAKNTTTLSGEDTSLILSNANNSGVVLYVGRDFDATFTMEGGTIRSYAPTNFLSLQIGQNATAHGTFRMNGGKLVCGDGDVKGANTSGHIYIGYAGSALFEVNGGDVQVFDKIILGVNAAITGPVTNHYRQTGGYVYAVNWLSASNTTQADRYSRIDLDGGVLHTIRIMGGGAVTDPTDGAELYANGGTLRARVQNSVDYPLLFGCKIAAVGEKGLTLDVGSWPQPVSQKFTDIPGQTGRVILVGKTGGSAQFRANGGDQSELVCATVGASIEAGVTNWMTTAVVTNNMVFSVAKTTAPLRMKGLSLGNAKSFGTLQIGPANRLHLDAIALAGADIKLENGFSVAESYPLITVEGELDAATLAEWRNVIVSGAVPSGYIARPTSAYEDGKTVLSLVFEEAVEPSVENVWKGVSGETDMCWDDADAWGVGVPDLSSVAMFSSEESSVLARVNVATLMSPVGKLAFTAARDYVLTGAGSLAFGDTGYDAAITVDAGDQTIEVPVETVRNLKVNVSEGASLTFADGVRVKAGSLYVNPTYSNGRVRLAGSNAFFRTGVEHNGGILEIVSPAALDGVTPRTLFHFQAYGTLRIMGEMADDEFVLPFDMYFQSRNWGTAEIVRTDRPTVIRPYRDAMMSGANLVKRGAAKLVFESDGASKLRLTDTNGRFGTKDYTSLPSSAMNIPEATGSIAFGWNYISFNVMEGEVVMRGTDASTEPSVDGQSVRISYPLQIGIWSTNAVAATPGLVLDHVWGDFGAANTSFVAIAQNAYAGEYADLATNAYLTIRNGSTLDGGEIRLGGVADASKTALDVSPRVTIDDAVCSAAHAILLSARAGCHSVWTVTGDSAVYAGTEGAIWNGDVAGSFGGASVFAKNAAGECATFAAGEDAAGELVFGAGSTCCATGSTAAEGAAASVAFDGGSLVVPDGTTIDFAAGCGLKALAGGLRIDVPEGETWTLGSSVSGEGAVLLHGAGTLAIDGTITAAFGGTGTVSGGTLAKSRIRLDYAGGAIAETPNFEGTIFTGRTKVDFGRAEGDILDASLLVGKTVARYTGTAPDVSTWKLTGTGYPHPYAKFIAAEGEVKIAEAANETGLMVIVR